jgi:subtilisin family serine protease
MLCPEATSASTAPVTPDISDGQTPFILTELIDDLEGGKSREVLLLFDDTTIRQEFSLQEETGAKNPRERLSQRTTRYKMLKRDVLAGLPANNGRLLRDFSRLPLVFAKIHGLKGLNWLRSRPDIRAIYPNNPIYYNLHESLPFIQQPEVAQAGFAGEGVAVAIIDTGVVYTNAAFGPCTSPGVPASCRVAASIDIAANDGLLDAQGHGTNVSAIVAGVAPKADLVVLDIFDGNGSSTALLLDAFNWILTNHSTYNITTVNLSLGDGGWYSTPCNSWQYNPVLLPINDVRDIGITVVAASGNEGYVDGISLPACTPGVISVGAVYDADIGFRSWTGCTDTASAADQITCFSNSANFLSVLAPGTFITAAGSTSSGTSQASPHVAGAAAVLAAAQPLYSPDQIAERLTSAGDPVIDHRNGLQFPRLNLATTLTPEIEAGSTITKAVPFLPSWALFSLATVLMLSGVRKKKPHTP